MFGSKSNYFHQNKNDLADRYVSVCQYLKLKGYSVEQTAIYCNAFSYFCEYPDSFDGATLVKDLIDLPGIDLDSMLHDYNYVYYNVASNVAMKWRADKLYAKENERKGKGLYPAYSRLAGLTLSGLGFIPFARIKRGKMTTEQKANFLKDYVTLLK